MRIESEKVLARYRGPGCCENCGEWSAARHAAHLYGRGMGSGFRLDIPLNVTSLCWKCHRRQHDGGEPTKEALVKVVAKREGLDPEDLDALLTVLKWAEGRK